MNSKDNVKLETWFKKYEPNERLTRLRADNQGLQVPPANLEIRRNFFSIRAANKWNQLPANVKSKRTLISFKQSYDKMR